VGIKDPVVKTDSTTQHGLSWLYWCFKFSPVDFRSYNHIQLDRNLLRRTSLRVLTSLQQLPCKYVLKASMRRLWNFWWDIIWCFIYA